jgi:RNA polymerase sigma factor (sigma-70 family)
MYCEAGRSSSKSSTVFIEPDDFEIKAQEEHIQLVEKIREVVKKLPDGFRVVLSLSLFEGFDHEEIAAILQISESTSRSQLARAKKKLIEYLKNSEDETYS